MTSSAYLRLFSRSNLDKAWKEFWKAGRRHSAPGIDGLTPADFHRNIDYNLSVLNRQLRGEYSFALLRPFSVPKANGKEKRLICVPNVADRLVQRLLVSHLMASKGASRLLNEASFGFIKGRGVTSARDRAMELRREYRWAYKSDIASFFDNVPRVQLIDATQKVFRQPSLMPILTAASICEIAELDPAIKRQMDSAGIIRGRGIRQGMPISPLFSNVMLENFDRQFLAKGYNLVRYADDFIILCESYEKCVEADKFARELLHPLGLRLPLLSENSKTQISNPSDPVEFLGLSLEASDGGAYKLMITDSQCAKIRSKFALLKDPEKLFKDKTSIHDVQTKIQNMIGGYRTAYAAASNIAELDKIFSNATKETVGRLYEQAFGKNAFDALTIRFRAILGIDEFPKSS